MIAARAIGLGALLVGCDFGPTGVPRRPPTIVSATVSPSASNVLSASVSAVTASATSVGVRFHPADQSGSAAETPSVAAGNDVTVVPVLGLLPETRYVLRAVARGPGGEVLSAPMEVTTGPLPGEIPKYTAGGSDPTPGYVAFSVGGYGIVIDNTGRVVWYHRTGFSPFLNFQPLSTGRYVAGAPASEPGGPFTEIDPLGIVTRTLDCADGAVPRFHDLIAESDGSYWLMCDEVRTMDLTAVGGVANANVTGTLVQHVGPSGERLFQWSAFDHFAITDVEASSRGGPIVNWTHGNAIDIDTDGNLLISFRSLNELTKVDTRTGAVIWRMGGLRSDFAFQGTGDAPGFARQHGLRNAGAGGLVILDNLGSTDMSRGERYEYDEVARTVRLAASYLPSRPTLTLLGGSTQRLPGGRLLVSYGSGGRVEEYDAEGRVVWQIHGNAGYVFRATRIASLYHPAPY